MALIYAKSYRTASRCTFSPLQCTTERHAVQAVRLAKTDKISQWAMFTSILEDVTRSLGDDHIMYSEVVA